MGFTVASTAKGLGLLRLRFAMFTLFNQWNMQSQHILQVHLLLVILNCQRVQCALKDWTKIQAEYRVHYVIIHFSALVSQSGPIWHAKSADFVSSKMRDLPVQSVER